MFLRVLAELRSLSIDRNEYDALKASRLLRQLLIDGYPLIDKANSVIRLAIRYRVRPGLEENSPAVKDNAAFAVVGDGIVPQRFPGWGKTLDLKRNQFLAYKMIYCQGRFVTIHQLVEHGAHIAGGVHSGEAKSPDQKLHDAIHNEAFWRGSPMTLGLLEPISQVVLTALLPLEREIIRRYGEGAHTLIPK